MQKSCQQIQIGREKVPIYDNYFKPWQYTKKTFSVPNLKIIAALTLPMKTFWRYLAN